jgi:hypothetical protein
MLYLGIDHHARFQVGVLDLAAFCVLAGAITFLNRNIGI